MGYAESPENRAYAFQTKQGKRVIEKMFDGVDDIDPEQVAHAQGLFGVLPSEVHYYLFDVLSEMTGIVPFEDGTHYGIDQLTYLPANAFFGTLEAANLDTDQIMQVLGNLLPEQIAQQ